MPLPLIFFSPFSLAVNFTHLSVDSGSKEAEPCDSLTQSAFLSECVNSNADHCSFGTWTCDNTWIVDILEADCDRIWKSCNVAVTPISPDSGEGLCYYSCGVYAGFYIVVIVVPIVIVAVVAFIVYRRLRKAPDRGMGSLSSQLMVTANDISAPQVFGTPPPPPPDRPFQDSGHQ
jgi:hypothetical protein